MPNVSELWNSATEGFMPHGYCLHWDQNLLIVLIAGNLGIALAYFLIPLALHYFIGSRKDLPYRHMFWLFAAFILACGLTHILNVVTLYQPLYWVEAIVDLITAAISLTTAIMLFPLIPKALQLRSPKTLEEANIKLQQLTQELAAAKDSLERQVEERTAQLQVAVKKAQEGEALFQELFDMMPQLAWTAMANGDIDFYNKGWYSYTGSNLEQSRGRGWELYHDPEVLPKIKASWSESIEQVKPFEEKFPLKGVDGKYQWFLTRVNPLKNAEGELVRWVGINTNIQNEVEQSEKLEQLVQQRTAELKTTKDIVEHALEAKSRLLATVSHEVRTPLSGIIGLTELLTFQDLGEDVNENVQAILHSSKQLMLIVNGLLDAAKMEAGKIEIEKRQFATVSLIEDVTQLIAVEARKKQLQVLKWCDPKIPEHLLGDEMRIRQVLLNLAFNAVKFTSAGHVKVSAELFSSSDSTTVVRFAVSDSGIGVDPEQLSRLFQPFEQAERSTARLYGGTGLGLSINKNLIELMGGSIDVTSEPGKGSTFWFDIPFVSDNATV